MFPGSKGWTYSSHSRAATIQWFQISSKDLTYYTLKEDQTFQENHSIPKNNPSTMNNHRNPRFLMGSGRRQEFNPESEGINIKADCIPNFCRILIKNITEWTSLDAVTLGISK